MPNPCSHGALRKILFKSAPLPTLTGLPDPLTTQPVLLPSTSSQASAAAQTGLVLLPGWNLISILDLIADTTPAAVLAPLVGDYSQIYAYDGCEQTRIDHRSACLAHGFPIG